MRYLWALLVLIPFFAHAQSSPPPYASYCASAASGPWVPCPPATGGSGTSNVNIQQYMGTAVGPSNPINVTQTPTALSYASPLATVTVTTASTSILAAATYTKSLTLCTQTTDAGNVWINLNGGAAIVSTGMYIPAAGGCINITPPTGAIFGISDSGTSHVTIQGS